MTEMICIVCPKGCKLNVDEATLSVTGNACKRGAAYGQEELTNPMRVVTSTVRLAGAKLCLLPVKTSAPIPKGDVFRAMRLLDGVTAKTPVRIGDAVVKDVLGTGVDFVATRSCFASDD